MYHYPFTGSGPKFDDTCPLTTARRPLLPSQSTRYRRHGGTNIDYATLMQTMDEWWERRWLRRHAMVAPFGIFATTALLTYWKERGQWHALASLESASDLVDLAAVLYAMVAVLVERGARLMFWALDERRKWRAKMRAEARAEGLAEGRTEGLAEGRTEGRTEGRAEGEAVAAQRYENWLAKVAEEKGIPLADLLPPNDAQRDNLS